MKIFETLFKEKVENFINAYESVSRKLFYDKKNEKLIHPGEFGSYRETILKDFLQFFIPQRLSIDKGFIITTQNNVSTECDVIIYDESSTPLIELGGRQRFFPVESVVAIGETKSVLSKEQLKNALLKLCKTKALREQVQSPCFIRTTHNREIYDPISNCKDNLLTFIVCEKFDFDFKKLPDELSEIYVEIPYHRRHNMVLSIKDGILLYYDDSVKRNGHFPIKPGRNLKNMLAIPEGNDYLHFKLFCSYMFLGTTTGSILYPEMTDYIGSLIGKGYLENQENLAAVVQNAKDKN